MRLMDTKMFWAGIPLTKYAIEFLRRTLQIFLVGTTHPETSVNVESDDFSVECVYDRDVTCDLRT